MEPPCSLLSGCTPTRGSHLRPPAVGSPPPRARSADAQLWPPAARPLPGGPGRRPGQYHAPQAAAEDPQPLRRGPCLLRRRLRPRGLPPPHGRRPPARLRPRALPPRPLRRRAAPPPRRRDRVHRRVLRLVGRARGPLLHRPRVGHALGPPLPLPPHLQGEPLSPGFLPSAHKPPTFPPHCARASLSGASPNPADADAGGPPSPRLSSLRPTPRASRPGVPLRRRLRHRRRRHANQRVVRPRRRRPPAVRARAAAPGGALRPPPHQGEPSPRASPLETTPLA